MKWAILPTGDIAEMRELMGPERVDRMMAALVNPPPERWTIGGVDYRPARAGEPVDLWLSLPLEGLVRQAFVKVTPSREWGP